METVGVEPTTSSLQARRSATRASSPGRAVRTGGVEPPQREAAGLQPVELAGAQRPHEHGVAGRARTDASGITTPDASVYTTATAYGDDRARTGALSPDKRALCLLELRPLGVARVGFEPTVSSS
jgi:hypothetical protein